ncbi:MAG: hypothetical protein R3D33_08445 [Hyphomicrobiaceae bacterium]
MLSCYASLQEQYNANVHAPDARLFSEYWESSLYAPIREFVARCLPADRAELSLQYCAPGAHAPLLKSAGDISLASRLSRIELVDIDAAALAEAAGFAGVLNPLAEIRSLATDLSGRYGQRLCDIYAEALEAGDSPDAIAARLGDPLTRAAAIFEDAEAVVERIAAAVEEGLGRGSRDVCVSEMMAAFTGTPAFLAFRSEIFRRQSAAAGRADYSRPLMAAARIWQHYNDRFLAFHLVTLRRLLEKGGLAIVVFDTEKVYDAPGLATIASFLEDPTFETAIAAGGFALRHRAHAKWLDHPVDRVASVHGVPVDDFKAHGHTIELLALEAV